MTAAAPTAPPLRSRLSALGLLAGLFLTLVLAGAALIGERLSSHREAMARLEQERQVLARLIAAGTGTPPGQDSRRLLTEGADPLLAGARVQSLLLQVVQEAGGIVLSSQALPATAADGLSRLPVQVSFEATIEVLATVLYRLDGQVPVMLVDKLVVNDPDGALPVIGGVPAQPNRLRVEMIAQGLWRTP